MPNSWYDHSTHPQEAYCQLHMPPDDTESNGRLLLRCCFALLFLSRSVLADPEDMNSQSTADIRSAGLLSASTLETRGATIGQILIENNNIFDLANPEENSWIYRLANKAHIKTRPNVIRQQLLFESGDAYSGQQLEETERILRGNRYLKDAVIEPVAYENGIVDLRVVTTEVWTLVPSISFGRKGGQNNESARIREQNLFGTGISIGARYESNVDRDSASVEFSDSQLGKSWIGLYANFAKNSDGYTRILNLNRPFISLDSRGAGGLELLEDERVVRLYDRGESMSEFRNRKRSYEAYGGWSRGLLNGGTRRYIAGLGYEDNQFSPAMDSAIPALVMPKDRKFVYPFIGVEYLQDKFEKTINQDQINRTEDRFLGTRLSARVGVARTTFGSSQNSLLFSAQAQRGFGRSDGTSLFLESDLGARWENGQVSNLVLAAGARYYNRRSDKRLLYVSLSGIYGKGLDTDTQILLGGDNGLRGYPLRYQNGDKSMLLTIEQRYFTNWYPFRLFNVGGAVFFDAGRTWGSSFAGTTSLGLLKNIGFGLRIGNSRSGLGRVIHVDVAFPLDGERNIGNVQFLVDVKRSF